MKHAWATAGSSQWHPQSGQEAKDFLENETSRLLKTPKLVKTMSVHAQLAMQAASQANPQFTCPPDRRALILCQGGDRIDHTEWIPHFCQAETPHPPAAPSYASAARRTPPLWLLHQLPNMTAAHLAREYEIRGATHSFSQSDLPLDQGWLTATLLFEANEADEILFAALELPHAATSQRQPWLAAVWHLTHTPAPFGSASLQELVSSFNPEHLGAFPHST